MNTVEAAGQGSSSKLSRDAAGITFDADSDALVLPTFFDGPGSASCFDG